VGDFDTTPEAIRGAPGRLSDMGYSDLVRRLGHRRWFARAGRAMAPVDRWVLRASGGRLSLIGKLTIPELILTTTGRSSGLPRDVMLVYAADGPDYVVTASNWGQPRHPAWSGNLLADPRAWVTVHGVRTAVEAQLAEGAERERVWRLVTKVWPAYDTYAARAGRDIRVFVLRPRSV
jgi:deazaflavin-dependent oxidoreductase (nitroreductase family)